MVDLLDKIKATYIAIAFITLAMSIFWWWFLVLSAIIMLSYNILRKAKPKKSDHELLAFTKEFKETVYKGGLNTALLKLLKSNSAPKDIKELSKRIMLGQVDFGGSRICEDKNIQEQSHRKMCR